MPTTRRTIPLKAALKRVFHRLVNGDVRPMKMTLEDYRQQMRRLTWIHGIAVFGILIPGLLGALLLTNHLADSSTWSRPAVFWSMFPTIIAPILIAFLVTEALDKKIGMACSCGESISWGKHVRELMREGGVCPSCGEVVVEGSRGRTTH